MTDAVTNPLPPVTIGMPVHNGEKTLGGVLRSLLAQSYPDFLLVISDNASTDATPAICKEYASADPRIRYVRQAHNIGAEANFRYVFDLAESEYFMWAAADDTRSADFIENNLVFLEGNPDYVGSTSPVRFQGDKFDEIAMGDASLSDNDPFQRLTDFFRGWHANGRFYSLFRRAAIADWVKCNYRFLGSDWTLITHVAKSGKLNRVSDGWVELGRGGTSNTTDIFSLYRQGIVDWVLPFHRLAGDTWLLMEGASFQQRVSVAARLARLNLQAFVLQFRVMAREHGVQP